MCILKTFLISTSVLRVFDDSVLQVFKGHIDSRINLVSGYVTNDISIKRVMFGILVH